MFHKISQRIFIGLVVVSLFIVALPAMAQEGPPPPPDLGTGEIIAGGLNGPQGLHVDADGNVYVIDSGVGGEEEIEFANVTTYELTPASFGETARVVKISAEGEQEVIATLPSVAVGEDFIGGGRLTEFDGFLCATVGVWHINNGEEVTIPHFGEVVAIDMESGELSTVADIWAVELAENPDGTDNIETHPYGIAMGHDDMTYVADAAANALFRVDPNTGEVEVVAAFEGLPGVFPNPFRGGELITDPVPTAVVMDEDNNAYVSLLSGAPFIPGSAKVLMVTAEGEVSDFATGLTMLTDLTMGPDGNLYATQFGMFTQEGPVFNSGAIVRIFEDGSSEMVVGGLPFLTAIAFNEAGDAFVTINGIAIPEAGAVVQYAGLTEVEGQPMEMPGEGE